MLKAVLLVVASSVMGQTKAPPPLPENVKIAIANVKEAIGGKVFLRRKIDDMICFAWTDPNTKALHMAVFKQSVLTDKSTKKTAITWKLYALEYDTKEGQIIEYPNSAERSPWWNVLEAKKTP